MLPTDYLWALWDLLRLDLAGEHLGRGITQLAAWLSGPSEFIAMIPVHAAAIAILLRVGLFGRPFDPWLRVIALAALMQHGIGLCYVTYARYHLLTWLLTCLVTLVWVNVEKRVSVFRELWLRSPSASRVRLALAQLRVLYGFDPDRPAA
jgi:hypothetical protein